MSKFDDIVRILNEYDVRQSGQGIPSVPGDGYTASSDPNIVGNAAQTAPYRGKQTAIIKPFADEANHKDNGSILPYPLEHSVSKLADIQMLVKELSSLIVIALNNADLNKPQKHLLQTNLEKFQEISKQIKKFANDLDILSIPH